MVKGSVFKPSWHCVTTSSGSREAAPLGVNSDILDDPLLSPPPVSQGELGRPQSLEASAPTSEKLTSPPPYYQKPSPAGHTQSGASYLPTAPNLLPIIP